MAKRSIVEVAALAPLDAKAAKVLGGGAKWKPFFAEKPTTGFVREEEGILPTRPVPSTMGFDLTGQRFGRFIVKGLAPKKDSNSPAAWVVRCDCGAYEHRKTKALRTLPADQLLCSHCHHLVEIRAGRHARTGPFNKDIEPPA